MPQICSKHFYEITTRKGYLLENLLFNLNTIYIYKNKPIR